MASILYLIFTFQLGTPFSDSLSLQQQKIKKKSISIRYRIFIYSFAVSLIVLHIYPLSEIYIDVRYSLC